MTNRNTITKKVLLSFTLWFLLVGTFQLAAALVTGKLTFKAEHSYLWALWLPTVGILTLETGILVIASLWLFCQKLSNRFGRVCAAVQGLVIPPIVGLCTGLIEEHLGHSLFFQWNASEGLIWGLVLALPNAVATLIVIILMAHWAVHRSAYEV